MTSMAASLRNSRWLQVALITAALLGVAAVAGASSGQVLPGVPASGSAVADTVTPTASPSVAPSPTVSSSPTVVVSPSPTATSEGESDSHGTYVSKVAHCVPGGPNHGKAVSEMARTHENEAAKADELCATYGSADSDDSAGNSKGEADDADEDVAEKADVGKPKSSGDKKSKNQGSGRGRGSGHGRGHAEDD